MFQCSEIARPPRVGKDGAGIGMAVGHSSAKHLRCRTRRFGGLLENPVAVVGMHRGVAITMENDGRHGRAGLPNCFGPVPLPHRDERGRKVAGGTAGQAGMYADRCVQVGIRRAHDGGSGPAGRQARDVDALRIDRMVPHDLAGDAGDQRGFAPAAALVARAKPVPALRLVGSARLFGIDHEAVLLFRQEVHPGAGGEIVRRLGAAVKHDHQRKRLSLIAAWDE